MPTIRVIDEAEATGELSEIYARVREKRGAVADILKVHSLLPRTLEEHLDLYLAIQFGRNGKGGLDRADREMLAVVVSAANGCKYCIAHHADALQRYWKDEARVRQLSTEWRALDLSERDRALCAFAETLTRQARPDPAAIEGLRKVGVSDEGILQATLTTAYFNFVNRIANATGVDPAGDVAKDYRY